MQDVPQLSGEVLQSVGVALVNPLDLQSLKAAASSCSAEQLKHASVGVSKHLEEGDAELVRLFRPCSALSPQMACT